MNNKKGSTIVWAVTLIMLLMVIVGASLSLAYVHYNQSIKNHNQTQAELIANSAIKSLASVIEKGDQNDQIIPSEVNGVTNIYKMELDQPFGTISDIKVTRKKKNLVIATLKATYSEQSYTVYAYITQSKGVWKAIQYDTNGNRSIKVSDSTGGNTDDNTGGNTGGDSGSTSVTADNVEKMKTKFDNFINAFYKICNQNQTSFTQWINQECVKQNVPIYTSNVYFDVNNPYNDQYNDIYSKLYNSSETEKLDDSIVQKAKKINPSISDTIYLHFLIIKNTNGEYCILGNDNSQSNQKDNFSIIFYNDKIYVRKNNNTGYLWQIQEGKTNLNNLINTVDWKELE